MDFPDVTVIRLGDPATRAGVFDEPALESVAAAAYDADQLAIQPPYQPVFDELRLGVATPRLASADGTWNTVGSADRVEASFTLAGLGPELPRIDALWRGAVVARVVRDASTIEEVALTWPAVGSIDADIEDDLGGLPPDPADLEDERRTRLIELLRQRLDQPARLDDGRLEGLLAGAGVSSVSELIETFRGTVVPGAATLTFSDAPPATPAPLALPVTAALLVRDTGFSLAQLLADTRVVRERLEPLSIQRPVDPALPRRNPIIGIWVIPADVFDDPDWPGATSGMSPAQRRAARRAAAAEWLAGEGIAVAVPP